MCRSEPEGYKEGQIGAYICTHIVGKALRQIITFPPGQVEGAERREHTVLTGARSGG